jgi:hypothetical protein
MLGLDLRDRRVLSNVRYVIGVLIPNPPRLNPAVFGVPKHLEGGKPERVVRSVVQDVAGDQQDFGRPIVVHVGDDRVLDLRRADVRLLEHDVPGGAETV